MSKNSIDAVDRKILKALQRDADSSNAILADKVGISPAACWRRTQLLKERGIVRGTVAVLDRAKLGLNVTIFTNIKLAAHSQESLKKLCDTLAEVPEIVEFYSTLGHFDYLIKNCMSNYRLFSSGTISPARQHLPDPRNLLRSRAGRNEEHVRTAGMKDSGRSPPTPP